MKLGVLGAGRMGREILRGIAVRDECQLAAVWVRNADSQTDQRLVALAPDAISADLDAVVKESEVVIDFTLPGATASIAAAAAKYRVPLVCGVSGLGGAETDALAEAAASVAVFYERNMSVGIAVLQQLVEQAAPLLGGDFEAEIHETHHVHKLDAPSGTALQLGEALAASRGQEFASVALIDKQREWQPGDIRFEATRRGEVAGDHSVRFQGESERLSLDHSVADRGVFANGAIRAALWLAGQPPGLYSMRDCVANAVD